ncbi:MAG: TetR/AcrR family transcriptional regulator [Burkholderiales bacterium]|jgi:AcrR family transcriptional regulator|uniref:TetR/AcrR family transcriptional regulator n=1 Tax=Limnobacter sp. TaxID=2003368 RepID=UPI0039BD92D0|nr:TetR/AcrR family transcriptional regulator [Burkholderiales bacterium]
MNYVIERREEEKERRREEILDAAELVFSEKGFDAATMDQVARKARVSRALVYVYFKDKAALHLAICLRGLRTLRDMFETARKKHTTGESQIRAIGHAYMQFSEQFPTHFAAMSRFEASSPHMALGDPCGSTLEMIQAGQKVHEEMVLALATGMADKTLRSDLENLMQISITLWGFTHGTIQLAQTKSVFMASMGISKESFMNQAVELVMQSLINRNGGGKK